MVIWRGSFRIRNGCRCYSNQKQDHPQNIEARSHSSLSPFPSRCLFCGEGFILYLKENRTKDASCPEKRRQCANIFFTMLRSVVLSIFIQKKHRFELPRAQAMLVRSLLPQSRNIFRDVFGTVATHFGLVHDVTDTDCWAEDEQSRSYFRDFQTLIFIKQDEKSSEKMMCVYFLFHSY